MRIGIDLDNTIICYDHVFRQIAIERDLIPDDFVGEKQAVRDHIRTLSDGETAWTALQAEVYGPRLSEAEAFPDAMPVLRALRAQGNELFIVSHKTRYAAADLQRQCDLREAAMGWLHDIGLVASAGAAIVPGNVFFEDERGTKCRQIAALACDVFIDDLTEVFLEPDYPLTTRGILFQAQPVAGLPADIVPVQNWQDIPNAIV